MTCEWDTGSVEIHGDTVSAPIRNTGDLTLHVSSVGITWSSHDETLRRVRLMGEIWSGWEHGPSFSVHTNRDIGPGSTRTLEFEFAGYHFGGSASVEVDGDC